MSVPAEIRAVPRPKNSIVYAYGKNKDRYAVKQRVGCVRKNGHCYPVDGPTIGHILTVSSYLLKNRLPLLFIHLRRFSGTGPMLNSVSGCPLTCWMNCFRSIIVRMQIRFCAWPFFASAIRISKTANSKRVAMNHF